MPDARLARTNTPYWWEGAPPTQLAAKPLPRQLDVAIVGAGYAGLSAGLVLARAGRTVVAFDAMDPGEAASSRNGGITSGSIRLGFDEISRNFGVQKAVAIEAEGKQARDFLYQFLHDEGIDCDFQPVGLFKAALGLNQYDGMARAAESLAKKLGIEAYAVPHAEQSKFIGTEFYRGGTVRMDIGGLHPAKLHSELLRIAEAAGLSVHGRSPILAIQRDGDGFSLRTATGTVSAKHVLVCTNGYTDKASPFLQRRLVPVRSRIIVTEELSEQVMDRLMPKKMMMGEARQLGFYYRPSPDGKRIILGGRDSSRKGDPAAPQLRLRNGLIELFPELKNVTLSHSWFGNVAMNRDMLPRVFEKDGIVYATGFCGSGVVWAPWLGMRAAYKLLGDKSAATTAFDFRPPAAVPLYRGTPWFMPAIIQGYAWQDRIAMWRAKR